MNAKLTVIVLTGVTALSGLLPVCAEKSDKHKAIASRPSDDVTTSTTVSEATTAETPPGTKKEKKHPRDFNFHNFYSVN